LLDLWSGGLLASVLKLPPLSDMRGRDDAELPEPRSGNPAIALLLFSAYVGGLVPDIVILSQWFVCIGIGAFPICVASICRSAQCRDASNVVVRLLY